jgi:hypothetical protein
VEQERKKKFSETWRYTLHTNLESEEEVDSSRRRKRRAAN